MAKAMSQMTETELDTLYEAALHNETKPADDWDFDDGLDYDGPFSEDDAYHAAYGDTWTDEDEAALEAWEDEKRAKLAIRNEY